MSTTIGKSKEQLEKEVLALQKQAEDNRQQKLRGEQNDWFFDLIGASGEKAIAKTEEKVKAAKEELSRAEHDLGVIQQNLFAHNIDNPVGTDKKAVKAWDRQLDTLQKQQVSAERNVQAKQLSVSSAEGKVTQTRLDSEEEGLSAELSGDKKTQKQVVSHAKYEPLHQHRLERLDSLLKTLEEYAPATSALVKTFSDKRAAAQNALRDDPKPWKTAYDLLPQTREVNEALGQVETLWTETAATNRKESPALDLYGKNIDGLRKKLVLPRTVGNMSDDELTRYHEQLDTLEAPLHKPQGGQDISAVLLVNALELQKLEKAFEREEMGAHDRKVFLEQKLDSAEKGIAGLAKLAVEGAAGYIANDQAVFERQLMVIKNSCVAREFADADDLLDQLLDQLDTSKKSVSGAFNADKLAWQEQLKDVPGWIKLLEQQDEPLEQALAAGAPPELTERKNSLAIRLKDLQGLTPGVSPTFADATLRAKAAEADLHALEQALAAAATFKEDLARLQQQVADAKSATGTAITTLETALLEQFKGGTPPDLGPVLQPLNEQKRGLDEEWADQVAAAAAVADLDADATCAQYKQIAAKAAAAATEGIADAAQAVTLAPERKAYADARQRGQIVAQKLMATDPVVAVDLLNMIDAIDRVANAATDPAVIREQAATLTRAAEEQAQAASRANEIAFRQSLELERQLKLLKPLLEDLLKDLNKISAGEVQKPYAALHATFSDRAAELGALVGTKLNKLLASALDDVQTLTTEIARAKQGIANEKSLMSKPSPSFGAIKGELAALARRLGDDTVKRYMIATAADLGTKIADMQKALGSQTLSEAGKEVEVLKAAVTKVEEKAKEAEVKVKEFGKLVDEEKKVLETEPLKSSAGNLAASLKGRFDALKADAAFEDGLDGQDGKGGADSAKAKLAALKLEVAGLLGSPANELGIPVLVFAGEQDALDAKRKAQVDEGKFEGEVAVLRKLLLAAEKKGVAQTELDGLTEALDSSEKTTRKSGTFADGREQLDGIRTRLNLLETNPQGLVISGRNRLGACNKFLKNEIKRFAAQTKELGSTIEKAGLDNEAKGEVAKALGGVRGLFNPAALDPFLPIVASQDARLDRSKRAAAREGALREVRRFMGYIDNDFRLVALANNPFDPKMAAIVSGLKLALLDIENNLLVSLPA